MKVNLTKKELEVLKLISYNNAGYGGTEELSGDEWFKLGKKIEEVLNET